jgi:hypothetical protein
MTGTAGENDSNSTNGGDQNDPRPAYRFQWRSTMSMWWDCAFCVIGPADEIERFRIGLPGLEQALDDGPLWNHAHWTKRIEPVLKDKELTAVLERGLDDYRQQLAQECREQGIFRSCWEDELRQGALPCEFDVCDWRWQHRGPRPRFWRYVCSDLCHWLVDFNLRLASLIEPAAPWRILSSQRHSTVWDGDETLFDLNYLAFDVPPDECFEVANKRELPVRKYMRGGRVHRLGRRRKPLRSVKLA